MALPTSRYYSVATLPSAASQPNNVQVIVDAQDSEYLLSGTVPIGGGTKAMRVKSLGGQWITYGRVRNTINSRNTGGGSGGGSGGGVNLLAGATDFSNAAWNLLVNATTFGTGLSTQAIKETVANGQHYIAQRAAFVGPGTVQVTIDAKANLTRSWMILYLLDQTFANLIGKFINVTAGTNGSLVSSGAAFSGLVPLTPAAITGGYTVGFQAVVAPTVTQIWALFGLATADGTDVYAGNVNNGMSFTNARLQRIA